MQFNVPQFETEDKLFGPFTVFQFLYVAAALVTAFLLFPLLATWFWLAVSAVLVGGTLALALVKVGGRPMSVFLLAAAHYLWEPKTLTQPSKFAKIVGLPQARPLPSVKEPVAPGKPATHPTHPVPAPTPLPAIAPASPPIKASPAPSTPVTTPDSIAIATPDILIPAPTPPPITPTSLPTKTASIVPTPAATPDSITIAAPDMPILASSTKKDISPLRDIFNKMLTSASPIPFREAGLIQTPSKKQNYEFIQKPTGETIIARRVDYR